LDRTITLASLWERIWSKRKGIILLALVAAIATGVVVFLMPTWYKADAELLPPTEDETPIGLASLIRGVGLPGVKIPSQVSAGDVFVIILQSRRISDQMIQRFDLMKRYKKKFMEDAAKELHHHATFKLTDAGTIRISVEDTDKKRAADMANSYIEFLDRFNREARMTKGRRTRLFIESRLADTKSELAAAEQRLAQYQVKNKAIALTPGASSAVEQGARMLSRRMALQIRLGIVRGYSEGSEEEIQIRQELAQLDEQIRQLPETGLELARLMRDVKAEEQVFALLTAQYEDARITEARDVVTVEILDAAQPPEKKSRPHRIVTIALATMLAVSLGVGRVLLERPEQSEPRLAVLAE